MLFSKKHKKDLKKMQANNTKAVSAWAEAIMALVKPQAIKPKMSKGPQPQTQLSGFHQSPQAWKANLKLHGQWL
jgi:large subunit ribosomal protein L29e